MWCIPIVAFAIVFNIISVTGMDLPERNQTCMLQLDLYGNLNSDSPPKPPWCILTNVTIHWPSYFGFTSCQKLVDTANPFSLRKYYRGSLRKLISPMMNGAKIAVKHYKITATSSDSDIREILMTSYHRRDLFKMQFVLLCNHNTTERILNTMRGMRSHLYLAMIFYTRWVLVSSQSEFTLLSSVIEGVDNLVVVSLSVGFKSILLGHEPMRSVNCNLYSAICRGDMKRDLDLVGKWTPNRGWNIDSIPFSNIERGFNGRRFTVGVLPWAPFLTENRTGNGTYSGLSIDILNHLSTTLNFTYDLTKPRDGLWGHIESDGKLNGIARDLVDGAIDLNIAPLSMTTEGSKVMDYTYYYYFDYNVILMKVKDSSISNWRVLIDIFSWPVLLCTVMAVPVTALILYGLEAWHPFPFPPSYPHRGWRRYGQYVWYTYGALLSQGGNGLPLTQSGRTMVAFWWLFSIMLTATFSGNLIAFLTVPVTSVPFQSLVDMVNQDSITWGFYKEAAFATYFKKSDDYIQKEIWRRAENVDDDPEVQVARVLEGNYAYIGDKSGLLYLTVNKCNLKLSKYKFFPQQYAVNFPKNSPLTEIFSKKIKRFVECGLIDKWKTDWWPRSNCSVKAPSKARRMSTGDVQSAFYVLLIGIVMGLVALLGEHLLKRCTQKQKRQTGKFPEDDKNKSTSSSNDTQQTKWICISWISNFSSKDRTLNLSESQTNIVTNMSASYKSEVN